MGRASAGLARLWLASWALSPLLWLTGCGEFHPVGSAYHYTHYKVQKSDTLYSIAFQHGYDYREVAGWNNIPSPYIIHAGDDLLILDHPADENSGDDEDTTDTTAAAAPAAASHPAAKPAPGKSAPSKSPTAKTAPHSSVAAKHPAPSQPATRAVSAIKWSWPTHGTLSARFSNAAGRKGIDLSGTLGQPVRAAADGDVVYSGSGLIGYGNLVIIKHDETFLSAYGHNRKLLVKEGDKVKAGQPIGEMGQNAKAGSILHFEIRRHGKPVDPLLYLPNQTS